MYSGDFLILKSKLRRIFYLCRRLYGNFKIRNINDNTIFFLMKFEKLNALSTFIIAFVTLIAFMVGFYYNLRSSNIRIFYILVFELIFIVITILLTSWVQNGLEIE